MRAYSFKWLTAVCVTVHVSDRMHSFTGHLLFFFLIIKSLFYGYFVCHLSCLGLGQGKGTRVYEPCQAEVQGIWGLDGTLEVIKHRDSQT